MLQFMGSQRVGCDCVTELKISQSQMLYDSTDVKSLK